MIELTIEVRMNRPLEDEWSHVGDPARWHTWRDARHSRDQRSGRRFLWHRRAPRPAADEAPVSERSEQAESGTGRSVRSQTALKVGVPTKRGDAYAMITRILGT